jgi:hypothetical protein
MRYHVNGHRPPVANSQRPGPAASQPAGRSFSGPERVILLFREEEKGRYLVPTPGGPGSYGFSHGHGVFYVCEYAGNRQMLAA